jgi:hypothetical protein
VDYFVSVANAFTFLSTLGCRRFYEGTWVRLPE